MSDLMTCRNSILLAAIYAVNCFFSVGLAHEHSIRHSHHGGTMPPDFERAVMTKYHDISYDNTSTDRYSTALDIYVGPAASTPAPVMIFVHGGGYRQGDKAHAKDLDPKPEWFTNRLGYVFVSINYRLLPAGRYPVNVQDVAKSIAWVHDNIQDFGGDPSRISIMGHSAGATLVAQVSTDQTFLRSVEKDLTVLRGAIVVDSNYDFTARADSSESLLGADRDVWKRASPVSNVSPNKGIPPFLLLHVAGGSELGGNTALGAASFAKRLQDADIRADVVALPAKEHFTANEAIGEPGDLATIKIAGFLESLVSH